MLLLMFDSVLDQRPLSERRERIEKEEKGKVKANRKTSSSILPFFVYRRARMYVLSKRNDASGIGERISFFELVRSFRSVIWGRNSIPARIGRLRRGEFKCPRFRG